MKLSNFFIEEDLSHKLDVYGNISFRGLDALMPEHLFNFIYGCSCIEEVLGVGMSQGIGWR
jgi:hypothetical protein